MPILRFKLNQDCRRHLPKQKHKIMNWRAYDASLRQRGRELCRGMGDG